MKIAFLNQKGGVGKTTLVLVLTSVLKRAGYDVAIDDRDPQGTSTVFAPVFELPTLKENPKAQYVIIDTPGHLRIEGAVEKELTSLIKQTDKLILVTEKSLASIHGSAPMAKLIRKKKRPKASAYVLFNRVRIQTLIGKQTGTDLAKKLGLPALSTELPLSSAFENAYAEGFAAITGQHRDELLNLALEIMK